jgi:hypothetical protein
MKMGKKEKVRENNSKNYAADAIINLTFKCEIFYF